MYSHMMVGSDDLERSKRFYDATFEALGVRPGFFDDRGRLIYASKTGRFLVTRPIDGEAATHGNGSTIGFAVDSPEQGDRWHAAGAANGGTPIEDAPGIRHASFGDVYLAYLRDPDGNKLCALHRMPKPE